MERDANTIIYTPEEQAAFSVPASEPAENAVETAVKLAGFADNITLREQAMLNTTNKESVQQYQKRVARAGELKRFSTAILDLCLEEHLDWIATHSPNTAA